MIYTDKLVTVTCCVCAIPFGVPHYFETVRRQDEASFYCPNGHKQHWTLGKSELAKLRERVADLAAARDAEAQQRRAAEAQTARVTKAAARQARRQRAGVCPCCNRTFVAMARHMKTQHPEFPKVAP